MRNYLKKKKMTFKRDPKFDRFAKKPHFSKPATHLMPSYFILEQALES